MEQNIHSPWPPLLSLYNFPPPGQVFIPASVKPYFPAASKSPPKERSVTLKDFARLLLSSSSRL